MACASRSGVCSKFLALAVSDAAEDVIGIVRAGARGYVTTNISGPELLDAIARVAVGDAVFSPRVAKEHFISVKTVETYVSSVLRTWQLSSRHELTR